MTTTAARYRASKRHEVEALVGSCEDAAADIGRLQGHAGDEVSAAAGRLVALLEEQAKAMRTWWNHIHPGERV